MIEEIYNYLKLDDRIATSGQPTDAQLADVAGAGYQVVINLAHPDNDRALKDEKSTVEGLGMEYLAIPVVWRQPTREDFERFRQAMDANRQRKVFVHCAANMRVSVFMALYRTVALGWKWEEAYKDVDRVWTPEDWWQKFIKAHPPTPAGDHHEKTGHKPPEKTTRRRRRRRKGKFEIQKPKA